MDMTVIFWVSANPAKTQICTFHLNNHQADRRQNINWDGNQLENDSFPVSAEYFNSVFGDVLAVCDDVF